MQLQEVGRNALLVLWLEEEEEELPAGSPGESRPATQPSLLLGQVDANVRAQSLESVRGPEHNVPLTPGVPQHPDGHRLAATGAFSRRGGRPPSLCRPHHTWRWTAEGLLPSCPCAAWAAALLSWPGLIKGHRPSCHRSTQLSASIQPPVRRRLHRWRLRSSSPACGPAVHSKGSCTHPPLPPRLLSAFLPFPPSGPHV